MRLSLITRFLKWEAASGIILFFMALAALILCNSPFGDFYENIWVQIVSIRVSHFSISQPVLFWVNEGLMTLFFLLVGLELKREFVQGELASASKIILPGMAALGGMIVPALLYCFINWNDADAIQGWAVPVATDIAFALGALSLFGKRVPAGLKLFLLALAIFDDVGAIIIIATFHSQSLSYYSFLLAFILIFFLWLLNKSGVRRLSPYLVLGLALWICVLKSGVHATVAGVLLAFFIPLDKRDDEKESPLHRLETSLGPWVAFLIMPLFALANAGLELNGLNSGILTDSVVVGTVLGLFIGKQLGVFLFSWTVIKLGWAKLPKNTTWLQIYGVSILCGIGFTMSLFLGTLTFQSINPVYLIEVRLGVLVGSLLSGLAGAAMLQLAFRQTVKKISAKKIL
jgi:Na+:H+ antiporter, NhaA family